jgi:trans-aconitate 2-methyltransferase
MRSAESSPESIVTSHEEMGRNAMGGNMRKWDADVYLRFSAERTQPARDLAARIKVSDPKRIMDLGCGPGNSTAILRLRWPEADIIGLDNSREMIVAASTSYPDEKWTLADASTWTAQSPYDIVFSNAALQWLPDHARLFPHLFGQVASGGALAVQMPAHHSSPMHGAILEAADDPEWRNLMDGARNAMVKESAGFYYEVLQPVASHLEIWETEYYHIMDGPEVILEWFRGTGLRPFLSPLESEEKRKAFEERVLQGYTRRYQRQSDGRILFPFRRLFIIAYHD